MLERVPVHATYFTAPWCQPCKTFKPIAFRIMEEEGLKVGEVDVDTLSPAEYDELKLMSVPTVIFWDEAYQEHFRVTGAFPEPKFREKVQQYNREMRELLG